MQRMSILDFLRPEAVIPDLAGRTPEAILAELCRPLSPGVGAPHLHQALLEREKSGSTGIGDGVAIPHAKVAGLPRIVTSFGRSKTGIDFGAIDGKPTHFFLAVLTPEADVGVQVVGVQVSGVQLELLARISLIFNTRAFREALLQAPDATEIYRLIAEEDGKYRR
jgi:PTS system nitrogen regulatory IIA component